MDRNELIYGELLFVMGHLIFLRLIIFAFFAIDLDDSVLTCGKNIELDSKVLSVKFLSGSSR